MNPRLAALALLASAALAGCSSTSGHPGSAPVVVPSATTTTASPTLTASPTQTSRPTPSATTSAAHPTSFVAVRQGRVAVFDYPSGELVRYLTAGSGAQDPALVANRATLFWIESTGACSSQVMRLTLGQAATVVDGSGLQSNLAVSVDGKALAWQQRAGCSGPVSLRVVAPGVARTFAEPDPPVVDGTPSWSLDDAHLVYFLRTGNAGGDYAIDVRTAHNLTDGDSFSDPNCFPYQPRWAADGKIFVLTCPTNAGPGLRMAAASFATHAYAFTDFTANVNPATVTSFSVGGATLFQGGSTVYGWSGGAVRVVPCGCVEPSS